MPGLSERDGLDALVEGLSAYLTELDDYRAVCRRHDGTAVTREDRGALHVRQQLPLQDQAAATVRSRADRLSGWKETPCWPAGARAWQELCRGTAATDPDARRVVLRGVAWKDRPVLVHAFVRAADQSLVTDFVLPPLFGDLPELPLRALALALQCHEHLLPGGGDLLPPAQGSADWLTVREYLERTTPRNLCVSQCFFHPGAGGSRARTPGPP